MTSIIITEKTSQKNDIANAIGSKYGEIFPAEGHLLSLQEPQQVDKSWSKWSFDLLKPDDFYATCPAPDGSPSARNKLAAIEVALSKASKVILATDCDREGQLIGEELLRHYKFKGPVERAIFTAQDEKTLRDAFTNLEPNEKYFNLGQAALVRQQADQVYNLSLTRAATVALKQPGEYGAIGIGRVKTPTMAIVCIRELEILNFEKNSYYHIVATTNTNAGELSLKYTPKEKITNKEKADQLRQAAQDFEGPLKAQKKLKRTKPPNLLDLPELQKICSRKWGWTANKTLDIAQELYDGNGKKIQTYPRAESRYLAENQIDDVGQIVTGLKSLAHYQEINLAEPQIRLGKSGNFCDAALEGVSHHAIVPNKNTMDRIQSIYPRLSSDEKKMFDLVASSYLAILMPDYVYESTSIAIDVPVPGEQSIEFKITGNIPKEQGWKSVYTDVMEKKEDHAGELPPVQDGDMALLNPVTIDEKKTKPPARFNEGSLIDAMQNAWRFIEDKSLQERLKEAKGIGTPATRANIITGLKVQNFLTQKGKHIVPTEAGLTLFKTLKATAPELVDPGVTALWEMKLDDVLVGNQTARQVWDEIGDATTRLIQVIQKNAAHTPKISTGIKAPKGAKNFGGGKPTDKMITTVKSIASARNLSLPKGYTTDFQVCKDFLDEHLGGKPANPLVAIEKRLASGVITGINAKNAPNVVEAFGVDSFKVIEETPERLSEVKGFTAAKIKAIRDGIADKKSCLEIATYLRTCSVDPSHAFRLFKTYGEKAIPLMKELPYQMVRDNKFFGFENADCLANKLGLGKDNPARLRAAIFHALNQASAPRLKEPLLAMLENRLGFSSDNLNTALAGEIEEGFISEVQDSLILTTHQQADRLIEKRLKALSQGPAPWPDIDSDKALSWAQNKLNISLSPNEYQAAQMALSSKLSVLNVAPGARKDNVLKAFLNILKAKNVNIALTAPTRSEAKKLSEETEFDVKSTSKFLEWNAKTSKYKRTVKKKFECQLLIVSAPQLLDRHTLAALLDALPKEAALLLITDTKEAPPLRAGNILNQSLDSEAVTSINLNELSPQFAQSQRLQNLHRLRQDQPVTESESTSDFFIIEASSEPDALRKITEIIKNRLPNKFKFNPIKDIQVICQKSTGEMGANALNRMLQEQLNPIENNSFAERFGCRYRVGDKVILNENNLDKDLIAHEMGIIKAIDKEAQTMSIVLGGKTIAFHLDELDQMALAYAIPATHAHSIEAKAVVLCVDDMSSQQKVIYNTASKPAELFALLHIGKQ
ncbi:MAG: DNA topoisomerase [Sneathiella sp.]